MVLYGFTDIVLRLILSMQGLQVFRTFFKHNEQNKCHTSLASKGHYEDITVHILLIGLKDFESTFGLISSLRRITTIKQLYNESSEINLKKNCKVKHPAR